MAEVIVFLVLPRASYITGDSNVNKIDFEQMYANCITSTFPERGKIPVTLETDELAIKTAFMWIGPVRSEEAKVIRIKNTLELSEMYVSEACLKELKGRPGIEVLEGPVEIQFDGKGNLVKEKRV